MRPWLPGQRLCSHGYLCLGIHVKMICIPIATRLFKMKGFWVLQLWITNRQERESEQIINLLSSENAAFLLWSSLPLLIRAIVAIGKHIIFTLKIEQHRSLWWPQHILKHKTCYGFRIKWSWWSQFVHKHLI